MAVLAQLVEEDHLIGEDVRRIAHVVVEEAQLRIQEAGRPRRWDHPGGANVGDVLPTAVHAALALLNGEGLFGPVWHVVDHRIPDGTGVLRHVDVNVAECRCQHVQREGSGVVHIENGRSAVGDDDPGVTDRSVGWGAQRHDHHVQVALGAADPMLDGILGLEEPVKAEVLEFSLQIGHREVR